MFVVNEEYKNKKLDYSKVGLFKNFCSFNTEFDFNYFLGCCDRSEIKMNFLGQRIKLEDFQNFLEGRACIDRILEHIDHNGQRLNHYVFASLTKLGTTTTHLDEETVFLIPTYGKVIYVTYGSTTQKEFFLEKGDLLIVPKNVTHSAIPLSPRIVLSIGIYN